MTNELTIVREVQPLMALGTAAVNFDLLEKWAQQQDQSSTFPGDRIDFKKGKFLINGDRKNRFDTATQLVVNAPNAVFFWRRWMDKKPSYACIAYPVLGQDLPSRDSMGDNEPANWTDIDEESGKPRDPWQRGACIVLRDAKTNKLYHFLSTSMGGRQFVMSILKAYAKDGRTKTGQLPVITLDTEEREHWEKKDVTFDVPTFSVVGWAKATADDNPKAAGGVMVAADTPAVASEVKSVTAKTRTVAAAPAPAVEDEDEEEEVRPVARKRRAVAPAD